MTNAAYTRRDWDPRAGYHNEELVVPDDLRLEVDDHTDGGEDRPWEPERI